MEFCTIKEAVFDIRFGVDGRNPTPGNSFWGGGEEVSHRQSCETALLMVGSFSSSNFHTVTMLPRRR